jgi:hypothetical protein
MLQHQNGVCHPDLVTPAWQSACILHGLARALNTLFAEPTASTVTVAASRYLSSLTVSATMSFLPEIQAHP